MKHFALSLSFSLIALTLSACNDKNESALPVEEQATTASEMRVTTPTTPDAEEKNSTTVEKVESEEKSVENAQSVPEQITADSGNSPRNLPIASTEAITELTDSIEEVVQDSIQEAVSSAVGDEVQKKTEK